VVALAGLDDGRVGGVPVGAGVRTQHTHVRRRARPGRPGQARAEEEPARRDDDHGGDRRETHMSRRRPGLEPPTLGGTLLQDVVVPWLLVVVHVHLRVVLV
jgi:hypothetical protein